MSTETTINRTLLTPVDYRNGVRAYLKDHSDLNRLLKFEEENSNDIIDMGLEMAFNFLNAVPPPVISYDLSTFPLPSLLIHQTVIECLTINSIVNARNDLTYNNGGVSIKIADKERYLPILQMLYRMADQEINVFKSIKVGINVDNGWGNVSSPYNTINGNLPIRPNSIL
jgi:hypothetical protein